MDCLFCKIIKDPNEERIIYEDKDFFVCPSLKAVCPGHILIIPKKHTDFLFNMGEKDYLELMKMTKKIAKALQKAYTSKTVGIMLNGLEILHVHLHLVPRSKFGELDLKHPKELSENEMEETSNKISKIIEDEGL